MSNYCYIVIQLILTKAVEVTPVYLKKNILESVKQLFGEVGASVNIDLLKFNSQTLEGILRVPSCHFIKLRASLVLSGYYEGIQCTYLIKKTSSLLLALQGDSRDYKH
ncbi:hypothetical protein ABEB36_002497 [Hypothenemus hampei]|uniref:Uncharacterized protein n=1 Tax=Hypothenemus hampei TaxID=57062 RepID=A0ABD1F5Y1_HYPHA